MEKPKRDRLHSVSDYTAYVSDRGANGRVCFSSSFLTSAEERCSTGFSNICQFNIIVEIVVDFTNTPNKRF